MNKQPNIYYYDQESYKDHLDKIAALQIKEKELLAELADLDKHMTDDCIQSSAVARTEQKLSSVRAELAKMRAMQIEVIEATEKSNTINIGHTYQAHVTYFNGMEKDFTFKLVSAHPRINVPGKVDKFTVESGIGKAILGKEIGEVCSFSIEGHENKVVVLKEIVDTKTSTQAEEME